MGLPKPLRFFAERGGTSVAPQAGVAMGVQSVMSQELPSSAARWRVLVVDQDPMRLRHVQSLAASERINVIPAITSIDALQVARLCQIDGIVIHDSPHDRETAVQLARLFRHLPDGERRPIVMVGRDMWPPVDAGLQTAARLSWPLDVEDIRAIRSMMRSAWSRATVLLIHDDPAVTRRFVPMLALSGLLPRETDPPRALAALEIAQPDVAILFPGAAATGAQVAELVRQVHSSPRWRHLPLLVAGQVEAFGEALRAGAAGQVDLEASGETIVSQVRVEIERARSLSESVDRDPLTGMLRPRPFLQRVSSRLSAAAGREEVTIGLVAIRLASPSSTVNDRVFAAFAALLAGRVEPDALWCRWGPLETAFCCHGRAQPDAVEAVQAAARAVEEEILAARRAPRATIELSMGVATSPADGTSLEGLILAADRKLSAR